MLMRAFPCNQFQPQCLSCVEISTGKFYLLVKCDLITACVLIYPQVSDIFFFHRDFSMISKLQSQSCHSLTIMVWGLNCLWPPMDHQYAIPAVPLENLLLTWRTLTNAPKISVLHCSSCSVSSLNLARNILCRIHKKNTVELVDSVCREVGIHK